jgi:hypothetical protein
MPHCLVISYSSLQPLVLVSGFSWAQSCIAPERPSAEADLPTVLAYLLSPLFCRPFFAPATKPEAADKKGVTKK